MTGLRRLVVEIHRRSLWQVLSIYLIGAWVAYQVILGLTDGIGLPDWVPGLAVVLFLIGLPVVVATAFVNEGPPMRESLSRQGGRWGTAGPGGGERRSGGAQVGAAAGPHWLTWRRSMVTGLLAFAVLGTGTAGFMVMRVAGLGAPGTLVAKGALDARDVVVLADFRSASDASLGTVVAEALRIDLLQTTILRVADPAYVRETLRLMQRDPADGLPVDVALELAKREGLKAVLTGDVATLGGGYILSVELLAGSDGRVLAAFREVARDSTQLIDAVDALSKQIRAKAGESLRTVRSSEPLSRLSTSSLPALRKYELRTQVLLASLWPIVARVEITGHRRYAMRDIDAVLHAYPLDSIPRLERPYTFLAMAAALAGEFDRADAFIHEWQLNSGDMIDPDVFGRTRAAVSLMREPSAGAIDELRRYRSPECQICILPDIGRAFEALAQPDSAIAAYRRFVETPMLARFDVDATNLAFILVRLGELLEAAGRPDDALPYYLRFLDLWKDADPELQPRVAAIRTRIQALRGEG